MKFNKICLIGAPNVGKSTLIKQLRNKYNTISIHPQFNQTKQELFPNKEFQNLTKIEIIQLSLKTIQNRINLEKKQNILLSERGILYDFAWIKYFTKNLLKKVIDYSQIHKLILSNITNYNLNIYIPIEFEFIELNKPFESKQSQKEIDKIILELLKEYKIKYITLTGTELERFQAIQKIIE
jgi:nicotinamide riboside kinase